MTDLLVGSTGFVGKNILRKHMFSRNVHSSNIKDAYDMKPDLCVYAGIPSAMYLANENSVADLKRMKAARKSIRKIAPKKIVLISTIAVYSDFDGCDERSAINKNKLKPYGKNRYLLEQWVREDFPEVHIARLPALYGKGLKKNFLYDLHHIVPKLLTEDKYVEIASDNNLVAVSYRKSDNGFYELLPGYNQIALKAFFEEYTFNALSFTDSRSKYQFYNLERLWYDIKNIVRLDIPLVNLVTPPVSAKIVYTAVTGKDDWNNELRDIPFNYNIHTVFAPEFGGDDRWIESEKNVIEGVVRFMKEWETNEVMY